jgi:hypothetical protein
LIIDSDGRRFPPKCIVQSPFVLERTAARAFDLQTRIQEEVIAKADVLGTNEQGRQDAIARDRIVGAGDRRIHGSYYFLAACMNGWVGI